jgi:hypothetical protein
LQPEKHLDPKISTDEGIQIDLREEHEKNPLFPICLSWDTGANIIAERNLHLWKHSSPRDSIDEETENDVRERSVMSFRSIVVTTLSVNEMGAGDRVIQFGDGCLEREVPRGT